MRRKSSAFVGYESEFFSKNDVLEFVVLAAREAEFNDMIRLEPRGVSDSRQTLGATFIDQKFHAATSRGL
jgi:hypothetical protein